MRIFLRLKHWQLFILLAGVPVIFDLITIPTFFSLDNTRMTFTLFPIMMIIEIGIFFSWFYTLGTNLYRKLPATVKMNLQKFKVFIFIPAAYMLLISVYMEVLFNNVARGIAPNPAVFALIIPVHLFSMFCIFYSLYFVSKSFKAVEIQRDVTFNDYAGEFFMIWFFPFGVWFIQPRINKIFADEFSYRSVQQSEIKDLQE